MQVVSGHCCVRALAAANGIHRHTAILQILAMKNKQALLLFLQLLKTLSQKPSAYSKQVNEINKVIQDLLQNINKLRVFQVVFGSCWDVGRKQHFVGNHHRPSQSTHPPAAVTGSQSLKLLGMQARATLEYALQSELAEKKAQLNKLRADVETALGNIASLPGITMPDAT